MDKRKWIVLLFLCFSVSGLMTGCGTGKMEVTIKDGQTRTYISVPKGRTVEDILEDAEIVLNDKDVVEPELDVTVSKEYSEITVLRYTKAEVVTEEKTVTVELTGKKVEDALNAAGVKLLENDYVNHDLEMYLTDGMSVFVAHRVEVSLKVDGKKEKYLTQADTVEEFLQEQKVELGELDRVKPALDSKLATGTSVVVKRVEVKELTETEPIEFETEVTYSNQMTVGTSKIITAGVNGEKQVTYEVTYVDGKEESRKALKEVVLKEAVAQEVVQGSKPKGKTVVSKERIEDCDGSGHGYYIITYSDGSVEYVDF
ncbi:MAG: ubiquitin-like domain-containing protein [Lachnospiraceae bacterium]